MPAYIVKDKPAVDYYVMWSDIVEAPTFYGTRAEMEACRWFSPDDVAAERFDRADTQGSSAQWGGPIYGYGDSEGFIYKQQGWLRRDRLRSLCERLSVDEDADVSDLLEPFED